MKGEGRLSRAPSPRESERDLEESEFTFILRRLFRQSSDVLAAVFVDSEGECVDYCTSLSPFDAKVQAAQWIVEMSRAVSSFQRLSAGAAFEILIGTDERDFLIRRVDESYCLALVARPFGVTPTLRRACDRAALFFLREADLSPPPWTTAVEVTLRDAVGWGYAPAGFVERGSRHEIAVVLGRWLDREEDLVCFRVRTTEGEELALGHDSELSIWLRLID